MNLQLKLISAALAIALLAAVALKIRHDGYKSCQADNLKSALIIKEKQDEIATRRPDTDALIDSLRRGKF